MITVLDAPTNLGLRPPSPGTVPGCYKLPWTLRDRGLLDRLGAADAGAVVPGRYDISGWSSGDGCFNAAAIADFSRALAARVETLARQPFLLVLGGECSLTLGVMLGLRRMGRYGLVYLDAHDDHRHPANSPAVGASGGEALALLTGLGQPDLTDLEGLGPSVRAQDVVLAGLHAPGDDASVAETRERFPVVLEAAQLRELGMARSAERALGAFGDDLDGVWLHIDADVLDPGVMPAVDCPEPDGLQPGELVDLVRPLLASGRVVGADIAIYDPDLDPTGRAADVLADTLVGALQPVGRRR